MEETNVAQFAPGEQVLSRIAGEKSYELVNHLGNVLSVISDKKVYDRDWQADLQSSQDYYAFGMQMPGRSYNSEAYRFGFNGKENDNEVKGIGNQQDYGMRIYDPRLGKFLSVDPLTGKYPMLTPYQFASNTPIWGIDLDGEEVKIYTEAGTYVRGNVGHTFISVGTGKDIIVYTYGRYDDLHKNKGSLNPTNPTGDGVLIKLAGSDADKFIEEHYNRGGRGYELTDITKTGEAKVMEKLDNLWGSSNELPSKPEGKYYQNKNAKVVDTYDIRCNNCTTKSVKAAKAGGTNTFDVTETIEIPISETTSKTETFKSEYKPVVPAALQHYLQRKSSEQESGVKDITPKQNNK